MAETRQTMAAAAAKCSETAELLAHTASPWVNILRQTSKVITVTANELTEDEFDCDGDMPECGKHCENDHLGDSCDDCGGIIRQPGWGTYDWLCDCKDVNAVVDLARSIVHRPLGAPPPLAGAQAGDGLADEPDHKLTRVSEDAYKAAYPHKLKASREAKKNFTDTAPDQGNEPDLGKVYMVHRHHPGTNATYVVGAFTELDQAQNQAEEVGGYITATPIIENRRR